MNDDNISNVDVDLVKMSSCLSLWNYFFKIEQTDSSSFYVDCAKFFTLYSRLYNRF